MSRKEILSLFSIGDKIIGNDSAACYHITRPGWVGYVIAISDYEIRVSEDPDPNSIRAWWVNPERFDVIEPALSTPISVNASSILSLL